MSGDVTLIDSGDGAISRLIRTATTLFETPQSTRAITGPPAQFVTSRRQLACTDMETHRTPERFAAPDTAPWPANFPVDASGHIAEGLVVRSISGDIEARTTGSRRRCTSAGCPGWFITVKWETGQLMHICSEGWVYDAATDEVRVVAGGEISARYISPKPLGTPPKPRDEWPDPASLTGKGWRVNPKGHRA